VLASSAAVYGEAPPPLAESSATVPVSPYGAHKLMLEHYGRLYARLHGLEVVSLRYFNVFGPRQDPGSPYSGVLSRFAAALAAGRSPTIFGDGQQTRDFVYVGDVARANVMAIEAAGRAAGRVFNVATGRSRTVLEAFEAMRSVLAVPAEPEFGPARPGDIRHSAADVSQIREVLGWHPGTSFEVGLRELLAAPSPCEPGTVS
ncbi:MAG: NAD-dependent epimerase/dehydratase family protein, partial [Candidatus Sericytochromatia bacterium]|nr:NAD-dependent epimerase/dehydratase family protein [Candidatus Tanganyikabacteria bacterium]